MKIGIVKIVVVIIVALILGIVAGRMYYEAKMPKSAGIGDRAIMRLRYSDHAPVLNSWLSGDIDLYIGSPYKGMLNEKEAMRIIKFYFRK